ncbi:MAG: hypothetical protein GY754_05470, partial [bacterium]|nr:hypothetical protein [bacterium]
NKVYYRNKTKDIHSWKLKKETVIAKFRSLDYKTIIQFITLVENTKKLINVSYVRINRDYRDPRVYGLTMKIQGFSTEQTLPREAVRSFIFDTGFIPGFLQYVKTGFSGDDYFLLKQLVLNERTIRADGSSSSSENIEAFINKLKKDYKDKIEDVSLNIRSTRQKNIRFFLTIRWKRSGPELAR